MGEKHHTKEKKKPKQGDSKSVKVREPVVQPEVIQKKRKPKEE